MNRREYLYLKLAEECLEVAHEAHKILVFGPDYPVPNAAITCVEKLRDELNDILASIQMLNEEGLGFEPNPGKIAAKVAKVNTVYVTQVLK